MYEWLQSLEKDKIHKIAIVIEGKDQGEKLAVSDGKIIGQSKKCVFLSQNLKEIEKINQSGVLIIEGQRVYCELIGQPASMVICGAGYVSVALIKIAKSIGMHVTVIEDRPGFADHARFAGADQVYCEPFSSGLAQIKGNQNTYFVVVTRGHRYDTECLEQILEKPYAYLGMMGSRHRVALMKTYLLDRGYAPECVEQIHMPIGCSIGAESPEEIAVSIMAEVIMVKNQKKRITAYQPEMIPYLMGEKENDLQRILATIVEKHGSVPRKAGTRMLILEDGRTIGTIGGGCAENEVIRHGRFMMDDVEKETELIQVHMSGDETQGMFCGGSMEVLLEKL